MVKFYRGTAAKFNRSKHYDGIYFTTDSSEIYVNNFVYGSKYTITDISIKEDGRTLVLTYRDPNIPNKEIDLFDLLIQATHNSAGLMSAQDKISLDELYTAYTNNELGSVIEIDPADKVLSIKDKLLSANLKLHKIVDFKNGIRKIQLLGNGDEVVTEIDATEFVKDGVLDNVEIVTENETKYIEFTWAVHNGETKKDRIAVTDLVQEYTAGPGVTISNKNKIGVKIYESDPYLTVDENGIKTKGIDSAISSAIKIGKSIVIGSEEVVPETATVQEAIEAISKKIKVGGITSIIGDEYISINGSSTEKMVSVNVVKIGAALANDKSALKVGEDGQLYIRWEN